MDTDRHPANPLYGRHLKVAVDQPQGPVSAALACCQCRCYCPLSTQCTYGPCNNWPESMCWDNKGAMANSCEGVAGFPNCTGTNDASNPSSFRGGPGACGACPK